MTKEQKLFYHGGPAGLKKGDPILPARELPANQGVDVEEFGKSPNQPNYSPDFVYMTQMLEYAQVFAFLHEGSVYEVRPVGPYGIDPDAAQSFKARRARIVRVLMPEVTELPAAFQQAARRLGLI